VVLFFLRPPRPACRYSEWHVRYPAIPFREDSTLPVFPHVCTILSPITCVFHSMCRAAFFGINVPFLTSRWICPSSANTRRIARSQGTSWQLEAEWTGKHRPSVECGESAERSGQKEVERELNPWRWKKVLILKECHF
jgi:hypothetical protein